MLSNEERELIEEIQKGNKIGIYELIRTFKREGIENFINVRRKYIDIIINLIEKQSKEIEILNKNMNLLREQNISYKQSIHGLKEMNKIINKKWKDKIKAKIEEIEKQDKESKLSHNYLVIPVLQSLLEKE